jgi:hypothetical protein
MTGDTTFQQGGPEHRRMGRPLPTRTKIISSFCGLILFLVACCPPATTSGLQETAFTATFLGVSEDGSYLLVEPEGSSANVQLVFDNAASLVVGQRLYVMGRLEGNVVYVSDLRPL